MREPDRLPAAEADRTSEAGTTDAASSGDAIVESSADQQPGGENPAHDKLADEAWMHEAAPPLGSGWAWPAAAALAVIAWSAFFIWVHRQDILGGATAGQWSSLIVDWSVPVLLVIGIWLLAMRNSRREATRFADAARMLASESAALEERMGTVNRELSLARDFIAARSRDLESLGRVAVETISANADRLQGLIRDNGEQVDSIARVSESALGNMDRLRDQLPVISNAARDMTSQIGNAGNIAQAQLDELAAGFDRLNQSGEASSERVVALRAMLGETLDALQARGDELDRMAEHRFELLRRRGADLARELETREQDNLSAVRRRAEELGKELSAQDIAMRTRAGEAADALHARITALRENSAELSGELDRGHREAAANWARAIAELEERMRETVSRIAELDEAAMANARTRLAAFHEEAERVDGSTAERLRAFEDEMGRRREAFAERNGADLAALEEEIAGFDRRLGERRDAQLAHVTAFADRTEALAGRIAEIDRHLAEVAQQSGQTSDALGTAADGLVERLSGSREMLRESGEAIAGLTDESARLLELICASSSHSMENLPRAIESAQDQLTAFEERANALRDAITDAEGKGAALATHVERARDGGSQSLETLDVLERRLGHMAEQTGALAEKARHDLDQTAAALEKASETVLGKLREGQDAAVRDLADSIGERSRDAIGRSLRESAGKVIGQLEKAAREAGQAGGETAGQLREQMAAVSELAADLEARVAQAREELHQAAESDLSGAMAQITNSLKSNAVDISRAFEAELPEQDWAAYLKGDRGIFARRAVRLLSDREGDQVHQLHEQDHQFRRVVNRYINDFEAMLRTVLATRQGNAMATTLLSSDIGKLYVALAQATQRLRS